MKIIKEANLKLEFEVIGYEKPCSSISGIIIDIRLNTPVKNPHSNILLTDFKVDVGVLNNVNTYEDILDSDYRSIYFEDYPILGLFFKNEYELMDYLYNGILEYAKKNNLPLFFQDTQSIAEDYANEILENISNDNYSGVIRDEDDFNDSYKLKWEISNYSLKLSNRYLEKVYFEVNKNNLKNRNIINVISNFWSEWNDIIPGRFEW